MPYTLRINGQSKTVDVPADMPFCGCSETFSTSRERFGCGIGACGACTVHLNGTAARAARRSRR